MPWITIGPMRYFGRLQYFSRLLSVGTLLLVLLIIILMGRTLTKFRLAVPPEHGDGTGSARGIQHEEPRLETGASIKPLIFKPGHKNRLVVANDEKGELVPQNGQLIQPVVQYEHKAATGTVTQPTVRPDTCKGCFRRPFPFLINSPDVCMTPNKTSIHLLMLIFSTKSGMDRRAAIRHTWGNMSGNNTSPHLRYVFLLGVTTEDAYNAARHENDLHHDLALQDFVDAYRNLTLKTLMGLEWHASFCSHARYVMKTDDDVYVNITNVLRLTQHADLNGTVSGYCNLQAAPIRDTHYKWSVSLLEYPRATYPGYCSGTGYVMAASTARGILRVSRDIPFFYLEDVYIALCVEQLRLRLKFISGFNPILVQILDNECGAYGKQDFYTSHGLTPNQMHAVWEACKGYLYA